MLFNEFVNVTKFAEALLALFIAALMDSKLARNVFTIAVSVNIAPTIPLPSAKPRDISTKSVVILAKFSLFTCNVSIMASMSAVFADLKKSPVSTVGAF
ncbi:hypothetical protein D3C81_1523850 [compost metagenome]